MRLTGSHSKVLLLAAFLACGGEAGDDTAGTGGGSTGAAPTGGETGGGTTLLASCESFCTARAACVGEPIESCLMNCTQNTLTSCVDLKIQYNECASPLACDQMSAPDNPCADIVATMQDAGCFYSCAGSNGGAAELCWHANDCPENVPDTKVECGDGTCTCYSNGMAVGTCDWGDGECVEIDGEWTPVNACLCD